MEAAQVLQFVTYAAGFQMDESAVLRVIGIARANAAAIIHEGTLLAFFAVETREVVGQSALLDALIGAQVAAYIEGKGEHFAKRTDP